MDVDIVPATQAHVIPILADIRHADLQEITATTVLPADKALSLAIRRSVKVYAGYADGELVNVFGVSLVNAMTGLGAPWMITTNKVAKCRKLFLPLSREQNEGFHRYFDRLENYVDTRNTRAIRWLKWLGYTFDDPKPHGPYAMSFRRFEKCAFQQ